MTRVGEEQERTTRQGRVQEVLAGTAEHFLGQHHAEGDAERGLPQGQLGRHYQGEQDGGHEEAFVDLVLAHHGEQHFPETTDQEHGQVDGQEVSRTDQHLAADTGNRWIQ